MSKHEQKKVYNGRRDNNRKPRVKKENDDKNMCICNLTIDNKKIGK